MAKHENTGKNLDSKLSNEQAQQFKRFVDTQNDLIETGACLLTGDTADEDYSQFLKLVKHVEQLWDSSCTLYKDNHYPQCICMSIAVIEEVGKVGVTRFQLALREAHRPTGSIISNSSSPSRRDNPFYSHTSKHLLAAGAGAIVNNRLRRIVGKDLVQQFLEDIDNGVIESLRQDALYIDVGSSGPKIPADRFNESNARFYVVISGEILAEVLGFEPPEWERLLNRVQQFEQAIGHRWE